MEKMSKSAGAPLGMAFLFLFLTAIPVSLKAVGVNISFSPRLGAVTDAWGQIAGVFTSGYQSGGVSEMAALNTPDCYKESDRSSDPESEPQLIARVGESEASWMFGTVLSDSDIETATQAAPDARSVKKARSSATARRVNTALKPKANGRLLHIDIKAIEAVKEIKPVLIDRKDILKQVEMEMRKHRLELNRALQASRFVNAARIVVEMESNDSSDCDKRKAAPVRVENLFLRRSQRTAGQSSMGPETSEL